MLIWNDPPGSYKEARRRAWIVSAAVFAAVGVCTFAAIGAIEGVRRQGEQPREELQTPQRAGAPMYTDQCMRLAVYLTCVEAKRGTAPVTSAAERAECDAEARAKSLRPVNLIKPECNLL